MTKTIHCQGKRRNKASGQQCRSGISTSPTPWCESLRQQHPNNSKQHGALAKIGNMLFCSRRGWRPSISNRSPGSFWSVGLAKHCCLLKLHWFWQKGHCSNLIFGAVKDDPGRRWFRSWDATTRIRNAATRFADWAGSRSSEWCWSDFANR